MAAQHSGAADGWFRCGMVASTDPRGSIRVGSARRIDCASASCGGRLSGSHGGVDVSIRPHGHALAFLVYRQRARCYSRTAVAVHSIKRRGARAAPAISLSDVLCPMVYPAVRSWVRLYIGPCTSVGFSLPAASLGIPDL